MLADSHSADAAQQWSLAALGDGYYRIANTSIASVNSLAVVVAGEENQVQLVDSENDESGQLWHVEVLNNGFCRFTSQLLGADLSLDIVNDATPSA